MLSLTTVTAPGRAIGHDSGHVVAELLGVTDFERKVAGLASTNLVQQGGELAYLIRHDPDFRGCI